MKKLILFGIPLCFLLIQASKVFSQPPSCICSGLSNNISFSWSSPITYDGPLHGDDVAKCVIPVDVDGDASTDDGYVAVGYSKVSNQDFEAMILRINSDGTYLNTTPWGINNPVLFHV